MWMQQQCKCDPCEMYQWQVGELSISGWQQCGCSNNVNATHVKCISDKLVSWGFPDDNILNAAAMWMRPMLKMFVISWWVKDFQMTTLWTRPMWFSQQNILSCVDHPDVPPYSHGCAIHDVLRLVYKQHPQLKACIYSLIFTDPDHHNLPLCCYQAIPWPYWMHTRIQWTYKLVSTGN